MTVSILIADDHRVVREGFRALLEGENGVRIVGEAGNGRDAVELAKKLLPDIVIMDVSMPDLNGIDATRQITAECPKVSVVGLSMHDDRLFVSEMLKAGAKGFVLKDSPSRELLDAIRAAMRGQLFLSPQVAGDLVQSYITKPVTHGPSAFSLLSDREREVLQLLAEGKSVKDISSELHLSVNTVHTHRQHIMEKLGTRSIAELTKYAIREGLTEL